MLVLGRDPHERLRGVELSAHWLDDLQLPRAQDNPGAARCARDYFEAALQRPAKARRFKRRLAPPRCRGNDG